MSILVFWTRLSELLVELLLPETLPTSIYHIYSFQVSLIESMLERWRIPFFAISFFSLPFFWRNQAVLFCSSCIVLPKWDGTPVISEIKIAEVCSSHQQGRGMKVLLSLSFSSRALMQFFSGRFQNTPQQPSGSTSLCVWRKCERNLQWNALQSTCCTLLYWAGVERTLLHVFESWIQPQLLGLPPSDCLIWALRV